MVKCAIYYRPCFTTPIIVTKICYIDDYRFDALTTLATSAKRNYEVCMLR